jgi:DNA repair exonuclease SbcCD ATPase subunit
MAKQTIEDGIQIPVDPAPPAEPKTENTKFFTEDDIQRVRQQEKDKLYKRLEDADGRVKSMEEQLTLLSQEREAAIKQAEERAKAEAEALRQREMEELSAKELLTKKEDEFNQRINQVEEEWKTRFNELETQRQAQEALLDKERYLQSLESYRQRRLQEEQETIIPELRDLVSGNNEDEIENSISVLRDRSSAIIESIQQASQPTRLRGAPVTAPPTGPLENQQEYQTMTAEDIRNMPMDQYVKMRERLLQARSPRGRF